MSTVRQGAPGATRICPHCRQTILESASICPACRKHLRFVAKQGDERATTTALRVEGVIEHPANAEAWEYAVVISVKDERGEEVSRHVTNVGALTGSARRTFGFSVEIFKPGER